MSVQSVQIGTLPLEGPPSQYDLNPFPDLGQITLSREGTLTVYWADPERARIEDTFQVCYSANEKVSVASRKVFEAEMQALLTASGPVDKAKAVALLTRFEMQQALIADKQSELRQWRVDQYKRVGEAFARHVETWTSEEE